MSELLYFEDLHPGQSHRSREPLTVTEADILEFGGKFDPQPFHLDHAAAKRSFFGGLAASGWHTTALAMRLTVTQGPPIAGGIIGAGVDELRWPRPVRPGDRLSLVSEVIEKREMHSRPGFGVVRLRLTVLNQDGDAVLQMYPNLVVPTRAAAAA